jgi:restriction system protein
MVMKKNAGPAFVQYMEPVISSLRALGGSARPPEVVDKVAELLKVSDEKRAEQMASGNARFDNMVAWARFYLAKAGVIDSSKRGVWALTDKGRASKPLSPADALELFKSVQQTFSVGPRKSRAQEADAVSSEDDQLAPEASELEDATDHREEVLGILMSLPSSGFERFCQRLLREAGFQEVQVTGRSGDEGIDGIGLLQVNPLVSFKVLFQCKRYRKSVTPSHVRDFRGAMGGRADKGIIITTGTFTSDARKEAVRDGVPAIELVDGQKLVGMLENLELGLAPVKAFRITRAFFEDFKEPS